MIDLEWYGCRRCGAFTESNDLAEAENPDYMVTSGEPTRLVCPKCGSPEIEDASECACGAVFFYDESAPGICPKCAEEAQSNIAMLREFYADRKTWRDSRQINPLYANFFDEKELDEILFKAFAEKVAAGDEDVRDYIEDTVCEDGTEIADFMEFKREKSQEVSA